MPTPSLPPPRLRLVSLPALAAVVVWGASFPAVRVALESFHPLGLVSVRLALGALFLAGAARARGLPVLPRRGDRVASALLGLILGAHVVIQSFAMGMTASIQAGWIVAFIPVLIALGGHLFLRQRLGMRAWSGVVLATAGVLLVASARLPDFAQAGLGDLLMLSSCFTWAAYCLLAPGPIARSGSLPVTTLATLVSLALALPATLWSGFLVRPPGVTGLATVLFLGTVCSGLALVWWNRAVHQDGPARAGVTLYLQPFVTLASAMLLLGERVTWQALVGGPVVLVGVWLTGRRARPVSEVRAPVGD
jgi:drug/metabolite transporter (DMT)-like permease